MKISLLFSIAALFMVANLASNYKDDELHIQWKNNMLAISGDRVYGKEIEILYIEAFCRTGSTNRKWEETTIPHTTVLISDSTDRKNIQLKTIVHPSVEVIHNITAGKDEVAFELTFKNNGSEAVDIDWFQPCIRVDRFTGRNQDNYISRSFIFTSQGMTTLDKTNRTEDALYKGGQVYVPPGIDLKNVNPRPISASRPVNGLIGCFSDDGKYLMATAWSDYQELFQGVFVCLHSDPRIGGLKAGEVKMLRGKLYIIKNDTEELMRRYRADFNK